MDHALAHEELEEGAQRREFPRDGGLLLLRRVERGEPLADGDVVYLAHVHLAARARGVRRRDVVVELHEVAHVVAQGVLADVALVTQVLEELCQ